MFTSHPLFFRGTGPDTSSIGDELVPEHVLLLWSTEEFLTSARNEKDNSLWSKQATFI